MNKKSNKNKSPVRKWVFAVGGIVAVGGLVLLGAILAADRISYYNQAANQAGIVQVREMILLAVDGLKKDAPVEPRTGDIYFPEGRLYLPNPGTAQTLTYAFNKDETPELSVSTRLVNGTEVLYAANNVYELFKAVPKLQACSRGIKLVYQKLPDSDTGNELKQTVRLNNGKDLYVYLDTDCPELSDTADLLKNVRAY